MASHPLMPLLCAKSENPTFLRKNSTGMYDLLYQYIDCMLKGRASPSIASLEMLDEVEELELVLEHYALTWGIKLPRKDLKGEWNDWGLKSPFDDPTEDDDAEV
jgi:[phosphatase 2A protein]-leucine-carboxy methyltransferase